MPAVLLPPPPELESESLVGVASAVAGTVTTTVCPAFVLVTTVSVVFVPDFVDEGFVVEDDDESPDPP
jgi:hypothetical protein